MASGRQRRAGGESKTPMSLLLRLHAGRDGDWRTFHAIYGPMVYQLASRRHRLDAESSEEIVAVVMEKLMRMFRDGWQVDHAKGRFRSVVAEMSAHAVADLGRRLRREKRGRVSGELDRDPPDSALPPPAQLARLERIARVQLCLDQLRSDPKVRRRDWLAFERYVLNAESAARVAKDLETTPAHLYTVKSRLLKRMRESLSRLEGELGEV